MDYSNGHHVKLTCYNKNMKILNLVLTKVINSIICIKLISLSVYVYDIWYENDFIYFIYKNISILFQIIKKLKLDMICVWWCITIKFLDHFHFYVRK